MENEHTPVHRTTVRLMADQAEALRSLSKRTGRTQAVILREAVAAILAHYAGNRRAGGGR